MATAGSSSDDSPVDPSQNGALLLTANRATNRTAFFGGPSSGVSLPRLRGEAEAVLHSSVPLAAAHSGYGQAVV